GAPPLVWRGAAPRARRVVRHSRPPVARRDRRQPGASPTPGATTVADAGPHPGLARGGAARHRTGHRLASVLPRPPNAALVGPPEPPALRQPRGGLRHAAAPERRGRRAHPRRPRREARARLGAQGERKLPGRVDAPPGGPAP